MRKWSQRSLNNLKGIHPDLRKAMDQALQDSPFDFTVIEGLRDIERQRKLVATGASQTMNSRHLTGHAVDIVPIVDGKVSWSWNHYNQLGPSVKQAADAVGVPIEWGGDWTSFKDGPHFQLPRDKYPESDWQTSDVPRKERTSVVQSKTIQTSGGAALGIISAAVTAIVELEGIAQYMVIGFLGVALLGTLWVMRDRLDRWLAGDR